MERLIEEVRGMDPKDVKTVQMDAKLLAIIKVAVNTYALMTAEENAEIIKAIEAAK